MKNSLMGIDDINLNFSQEGLLALNITIALILFGVALEIKTKHFKKIIQHPKATILGFVSQFFVLPALTFVFVSLLKNFINPSIALGMILVAACPGGNISNFISTLAKGNAALSVSLTAIATISATFFTPLNFSFWGNLYSTNSPLLVPIEIPLNEVFKTVFILLGIPLILGMLFNWQFPKTTEIIAKPIKKLSIIIFIIFIVIAFSNNYDLFIKYIKYIFIIVLLHNALALSTGYFIAHLFKLSKSDKKTISIETGIQNSGLALILIFNPNIFPETLKSGGLAFVAAWWGIWHIISGLLLAFYWSKKTLKT